MLQLFAIALCVLFALAWLSRSLVLWYWRINRIVGLLESIDESLKQLPAVRRHNFQSEQQGRKVA